MSGRAMQRVWRGPRAGDLLCAPLGLGGVWALCSVHRTPRSDRGSHKTDLASYLLRRGDDIGLLSEVSA